MATHTSFKNVTSINQSTLSDQIESNVASFFNWGFLGIGGFFNVTIPSSGAYGGLAHQLRRSEDSRYSAGQVWEGFRKNWIWESGVDYSTQPISISGVYVNGTFYPSNTTGAYSHKVDYPNGRIIFNSPISTTATVTCNYSYRYIQFYNADAQWYRKLQSNSFRVDDTQFRLHGSGQWSVPPEQRVQLPAVIVQSTPNESREGYEIGSLSQNVDKQIKFTIITETNEDLKFISDVINEQVEKTLLGFDKNLIISATGFPINYDGSLATNAKCYPALISQYPWKQFYFKEARSYLETEAPIWKAVINGVFRVQTP